MILTNKHEIGIIDSEIGTNANRKGALMNQSNTACKTGCLSGNALKIVAMIAMLIDHIGYYLFPQIRVLRYIGRLAFPIFAYMIAEGCIYTRNRWRYFGNVAALGILCHIPLTAAKGIRYIRSLGILFTFAASIFTIICIETLRKDERLRRRIAAAVILFGIVCGVVILPEVFHISIVSFDYGAPGIALPVLLYYLKDKRLKLLGTAAILLLIAYRSGAWSYFSLASLPLLALYSGKRGTARLKYLFYIFYPLHLVTLISIYYIFFR